MEITNPSGDLSTPKCAFFRGKGLAPGKVSGWARHCGSIHVGPVLEWCALEPFTIARGDEVDSRPKEESK